MAAKKGRPRNAGNKRGQATKPAPGKPSGGKPDLGNTHSRGPNVGTPGGSSQGVRRPPTRQQPAGSPLSALPDSLRGRWDGNYGGKPQGGPSATERIAQLPGGGATTQPVTPGGDMPISFNQGGQPGGMDFTDFQSQFGGGGGGNAPPRQGGIPSLPSSGYKPQPDGRINTGMITSPGLTDRNLPQPGVSEIGVAPPPPGAPPASAPPGRVNPVRHGQGNLGRGQGRGPLAPPTAPGPGGMPMGVEPGGVNRGGMGGVPPLPPTTAGPGPGQPRPVPGLECLPGVRPGMGPGPGGPVTMGPPSTDRGPSFGGAGGPVAGGLPPGPSTDRLPTPGGGMSFAPPPDPGMISPGPGPAGPTRMPPVGGPMGGPMKRPAGPRLNRLMETGQVDPGIARLALQ